MKPTIDPPEAETCVLLPPAKPCLNIVLICDGLAAAAGAHDAIESLSQEVDDRIQLRVAYWSFDTLDANNPEHLSRCLAPFADLLIVSTLATSELPAHVRAWILKVMSDAGDNPPCLAALSGDAQFHRERRSPLRDFLSGVASLWSTELICHTSRGWQARRKLVQDLLHHARSHGRPGDKIGKARAKSAQSFECCVSA